MKRFVPFLLMVFLLTGCTNTNRELERGMAIRSRLLASGRCSFRAEITADYGDKLHTFSMECTADREGDLTFKITQPDTIAGITGTISDEGGRLTFDETALCFPLLADDQLSPVSGPWIFLKTLRSGYLKKACTESNLLRLTIDDSYEEDALQLDIWLNDEDQPVRTEILYGDRRILTLSIVDFEIQ